GELERLLAAGNFEVTPLPDAFDYVYEREALSTLAGKVFHGKRGHIAAFSAKYAWEYERIDDANTPEVLQAAAQWCSEHGCCQDDSLTAENCAIVEAMMNRDALNIKGGLLRVDGKVIAFTFASPITDEVADIHVEKALSDYADAYAVINREFAARELSAYRYINRENDLGVEGLRKAKRSYHPAFMVEKYLCVEK
ncbi:MAG: phosphatidylglycerol lysyltransferase domain-containing protein, partial [Oscillospiraceae bacterium]|nr:phosphatidylglycerol lysyltransferase domain-containing protein [Oscillospiraceae bacterium]